MGFLTPTIAKHDANLMRVAKIIDNYTLVINRGYEDDIKIGDKFLIYSIEEEETLDPITKTPLGYLEIVKGIGKVTHVQEKLATIQSNHSINEIEDQTIFDTWKKPKYVDRLVPFNEATIGDLVKPI